MMTKLLLLLLLCASHRYVVVVSESPSSKWYTKYESYPPYCSTPSEMEKRRIPNIQNLEGIGETRLVHVSAIFRHGARTPNKSRLNCWDSYAAKADLSKWDCNLTTFLAPPPPERIHQEEGGNDDSDMAMFLFEKLYDALEPADPSSNATNDVIRNELGGTCQMGQLLLQGYEQELMNGKILREAYVYEEKDHDHDPRMELLYSSKNGVDEKYIWDSVHYRSDDDQRTLMSGQVVLRGMFNPELTDYVKVNKKYPIIPLHTADRHRDIVSPNEVICPRLQEIEEQNMQSSEFKALNTSMEANTLRAFQTDVLKIPDKTRDMDINDCLMTTICTDRTLPDAVNDYNKTRHNSSLASDVHVDKNNTAPSTVSLESQDEWDKQYGSNRFQRLIDFRTSLRAYNSKANDGLYSKFGIGPLWYEVMKYIHPFIDGTKDEEDSNKFPLSIISGHDGTLIPMLVSLGPNVWDGIWPPYASMMIVEVHAINIDGLSNRTIFRSNYAFRLLYNGMVLTNKIDGCYPDMELCDVNILIDRLKDIAIRDINCTREHTELATPKTPFDEVVAETELFLQSITGANGTVVFTIFTALGVIISVIVGALFTYTCLTGWRSTWKMCCIGGYHLEDANGNNYRHSDEDVTMTASIGDNYTGVGRHDYMTDVGEKNTTSLSIT